jgi:hypothetical protein
MRWIVMIICSFCSVTLYLVIRGCYTFLQQYHYLHYNNVVAQNSSESSLINKIQDASKDFIPLGLSFIKKGIIH